MANSKGFPRQKTLTLALAAALSSGLPLAAQACTPTTIGSTTDISSCTTGVTLSNAYGTVTNSGYINNTNLGHAFELTNTGSIGTFTNTGTIQGNSNTAAYYNGGTIGTLSNSGTISNNNAYKLSVGIVNNGNIDSLTNASGGLISASMTGILNNGTIGSLTNSGQIVTSAYYFAIANTGSISSLINNAQGIISGDTDGIYNTGTIGTLTNNGSISASTHSGNGIYNSGTIGTLSNSGTISASSRNDNGVNNAGTIGTLGNSGTIIGSSQYSSGINNTGTIGTLSNDTGGLISGAGKGVSNSGIIGTLANNGTISASSSTSYGINNSGSIGTLSNNGTISANNLASYGIYNSGTIGALTNSGTIGNGIDNAGLIGGGVTAIDNTSAGNLGTITNTGTIAGNIINTSTNDLHFVGGATEGGMGVLTGASGIGTITNTGSMVYFDSSYMELNDDINVGTGTVTNTAATLRINNPVSITGNFTQAAASTLEFGVGNNADHSGSISDIGYGRLNVSGVASLASGSTIDLHASNSFVFAAGQRFLVVTGNGSSTYGSLVEGAGASSSGVDSGLNLDTNETSATGLFEDVNNTLIACLGNSCTANQGGGSPSAATTLNAVAALGGLSNGSSNTNLLPLYDAMLAVDNQGTAAANHAGAQLSAAPNVAAGAQAAMAPTTAVLNIVTAHADTIRLAQADGASGVSAGERPEDWAVWGEGFGGQTSQDERDDIAGYNAHYNGLLIGADSAFGEHWRAGGLFSYGNTSVADTGDNSGSSTHVDSFGLFGYASYTGKAWYLNLSGGAVQQQYDTLRYINITDYRGDASGQHNGMQYVASAEAGHPINLGDLMPNTTLTPIAALNYSYLAQNAYTESGGGAADLSVGSTHDTSIKSDLGAKLERGFITADGELVPSVQLSWRHEYQDSRLQTNADFAADTTGVTGFITDGPTPIKDRGVLTIAATLLRSNNLTLALKYEIEAASGYTSQVADIRMRYLF